MKNAFSSTSRNFYAESLLPLLIIAQRELDKRGSVISNKQKPTLHFDNSSGILLTAEMAPATPMHIEVGAHIDPTGHNLYRVPEDGQRFACVPTDFSKTLNLYQEVLDRKPYTSRALEHSRKLLLSYLAGIQFCK